MLLFAEQHRLAAEAAAIKWSTDPIEDQKREFCIRTSSNGRRSEDLVKLPGKFEKVKFPHAESQEYFCPV